MREEFWKHYQLNELTSEEWEALCDGCGQCCLVREVAPSRVTVFNIACELLDIEQSRCSDYANRLSKVPYCNQLTPENVPEFNWLPESCAYRCVYRGEELPAWHPLLTGSREQMRQQGITVSPTAISVEDVPRSERPLHIIKVKQLD